MKVVIVLAMMLIATPAFAAGNNVNWSFETEETIDPNGFNSFSQYVFLDDSKDRWNLIGRYFRVEKTGPEHLELKGGPNIKLSPDLLIKTNAGLTSDGRKTLGCCVVAGKGKLIYILDPKWSHDELLTVFQKVMLPDAIHIGDYAITLRAETITYLGRTQFLRIGPEFPVARGKINLSVAPFYDVTSHKMGGFITARF